MMDAMDATTDKTDAEQARELALAARVEAFGCSLLKSRQAAIDARKASGIEEEWAAAEDAYHGVDDHNRGSTPMAKPTSPNGGLTGGGAARKSTRSTVVLNITRPYVDAAAARVGDMLLPTDDSPWAIKPTPIASLTGMVTPEQPAMQPMAGPGAPMGQPSGMPGQAMQAVAGLPQAMAQAAPEPDAAAHMAAAKKAAEGATTQIED